MSERIVKRERTKEGEEYVVAARSVERQAGQGSGTRASATQARDREAPGIARDQPEQQARDRVLSDTERLVAEANEVARDIVAQAEADSQHLREQLETELTARRTEVERELEAKRSELERETRQRLGAEYRERYAAAMEALDAAAADLRERREQYLAEIEVPALKLVLAVARQLLKAELNRSPEFLAALIGRACSLLQPDEVITVAVHPEVRRLLREDAVLTDALRGDGVSPERVKLVIDDSLAREEFAARISGMSVDYDLDALIRDMVDQLEQRARSARSATDDHSD